MLFNSYIFILCFLPLAVVGWQLAQRLGFRSGAQAWLFGASVFFYGWWNPAYVPLLGASIVVNYGLGRVLTGTRDGSRQVLSGLVLVIGIIFNLSLIGVYKYADFFLGSAAWLANEPYTPLRLALPLAISFFTFQQIAFLVDCKRGITQEPSFLRYGLFVSFFPQLIAGPIVHHRDLAPQLARRPDWSLLSQHRVIGVTLFAAGLFKKVVIADPLGEIATPVFAAAEQGALGGMDAWLGTLGYTLQLYFDFSGYSDMALGLGHLFGVTLPMNFDSPYRATSIQEFWRRWHITLSEFFRDYLFIPLGGSRAGLFKAMRNVIITMILGGLWHGAGWTFVAWGAAHGVMIAINHAWQNFGVRMPRVFGWAVTLLCVSLAWVVFRAESFGGALEVYRGLVAFGSPSPSAVLAGDISTAWTRIAVGFAIALTLPNAVRITRRHEFLHWQLGRVWAAAITVAMFGMALSRLNQISEFLYFNF